MGNYDDWKLATPDEVELVECKYCGDKIQSHNESVIENICLICYKKEEL